VEQHWGGIIAFFQVVIGVMMAFGLKAVFAIKDDIGKVKTGIVELKTWTEGHERLDEERFRGLERRLDDEIKED